jgi:uroporphyrinogen-III decarboxylase
MGISMEKVIEIGVPIEEIRARTERVEKARQFKTPDRVPVIPAINYRTLLPKVGVSFKDYYRDAEVMLRAQIMAQKWLMENIHTDASTVTGAWVGGWTDFQNATEASSFGCRVYFPPDDIPVAEEAGWVRTDADLHTLEQVDFVHTGLNQTQIEFRQRMMQVAEKYPVRFLDGPIFYPGENPALTHTSNGPFTISSHLMGAVELFTAILERPEFVSELLRIVTDKVLDWLDYCWEEEKIPNRNFAWTDDLSAYLSAETWQTMVLPHDKRLRDHFDYASLHMCGHTAHLLHIFADQLKINEFQGFGWEVDLERIAEAMGGKVVLLGNVSPLLIEQGTPGQVKEATRRVIEKLAPYRGLIIQDGNNISPNSPIENINAMTEAAETYGRYV